MNRMWLLVLLAGSLLPIPAVHAETLVQSFEGGMDAEITYPERIAVGREGVVSILLKNNGWEDKQDISLEFSLSAIQEPDAKHLGEIRIDRLGQGGSFGENIRLHIPEDAGQGKHFLNLRYSQVLVANNETPQPPIFHDIAIPIAIRGDPSVTIHARMPESIFTNAEFPIEVEIISEDIDITDVGVRVIPPDDIEFRGETLHTFSRIEAGTPVGMTSRIITPMEEVGTEYRIPFEIIVEYTDDMGRDKTDSHTTSVILRPRTFMELTTDGGLWIGNFFIAPYVSLGTIIGIPAGALFSLLIRRRYGSGRSGRKKA